MFNEYQNCHYQCIFNVPRKLLSERDPSQPLYPQESSQPCILENKKQMPKKCFHY